MSFVRLISLFNDDDIARLFCKDSSEFNSSSFNSDNGFSIACINN
jgi:hypothetical protein